MPQLACPDRRDLEHFIQGQLSEAAAASLGEHLLHCSACAQLLDQLQTADPLVQQLRNIGQRAPAVPGVDDLIERLVRLPPSRESAADSTPTATEIPAPAGGPGQAPARLGRYQILDRLGAGGMGVVYRAHDPQLGRDVAIKVPSFRGVDAVDRAARQRFLREARVAAAVRHAHVCPIYDVGEEQGQPYVVLALIEGESLAERLRRQGRFEDVRAALGLLLQVAEALVAVHVADIVHRDLKPGNILLDRAGQPFLTDFGLARAEDNERLTATGQLLGTPAYMAPEQVAPELGLVGPWSDQYSLGVVFYEMLTSRLPFEGSVSAMLAQLSTRAVPPPSLHRPDLDAGLESLLLKALAREARNRFPSVLDLANALRGWREGAATPPSRPRLDAQRRRRVTVLQAGCDLFESEALLAALDPEEQHVLLGEFQQVCRELTAEFEGTVVKTTNHGLLICFGFPRALEAPARRAVRAGLTLHERMAGLNERLGRQHQGLRLAVRVAVHSDLAVVTENPGPQEGLTIVGQVLPAVDQLEHLAAPDSVTISDDVHQLVQGFFECTSLAPQKLGAGSAKPLYRVHRQYAVGNRVDMAGPTGLTPLIGRDREVALLQGRWEQTAEGLGQVVLLVGEAGIGKSRLVRVLKDHVQAQPGSGSAAAVIEWPCTPQTQNSSLLHAREFFARFLGLNSQDAPAENVNRVARHLQELHLGGAENVFLLTSVLSLPPDQRYPNPGWSPLRQKERTFDLLVDWLRQMAHRHPVLFVVEDLHWAGPTTLEFLDLLCGQTSDERILTVLTYRPEFQPPWKSRAPHTQVSLTPLTRRQTGELLVAKTGLPNLPQDVVELVAERTDGVPLFVEEFAAMLQGGSLYAVGSTPQLADVFEDHAIPATLQDLLLARLERAAGRFEVVQLAATIGREFSHELLRAVAPWEEEVLQVELARLVEAGLLFVRGRPPQTRYQFKHALIQDAAYQSLLKNKRQQFHGRIAETFEQRFPETSAAQPELLAHHFTEANLLPRAVVYWERAGEHALQRGAAEEAVGHCRRGLELLRSLPETADRDAQEIQVNLHLGVALAAARGFGVPELEVTYARVQTLCSKTGALEMGFPALFGLLRYYMNRGLHARAQELAEEMLRLANRETNPVFLLAGHCSLGVVLLSRHQHPQAVSHLEQAIALEPTPELRQSLHRYAPLDVWVSARFFLSWAQWLLGFSERAAEIRWQALQIAEQLNHPFTLCWALCYAAWGHQFGREREQTQTTAARALTLAAEKGFPGLRAWAQILQDWALADSGQAETAVKRIHQALEDLRAQGALSDRNGLLPLLAEALARAGRPEEGLQALDQALDFVAATSETFFQAELHRLKGELLLQHDPAAIAEAEVHFQQALTVARAQQARSLELRAATSLARWWTTQGKIVAARELLAPVYHSFTEGFQTHDLQQAKALLDDWQDPVAK